MHIIYIEDDPGNVALVERVARSVNDTLTTFTSVEEALEQIRPGDADLILTDIYFGDNLNGFDLTHVLRERGVDVPIIAITAYDLQEYVRWAEEVGNDEFIVKPVDVNDLLSLLNYYRR